MWGTAQTPIEELPKNQQRKLAKKTEGIMEVPNILTPFAGESYNPTPFSHSKLLEHIVKQDDQLVNGIKMGARVKDLSKYDNQIVKAKPRSKKEKLVMEELEVIKKLKEKKIMEYNYGKFLKDAKKDLKVHGKKLEDREEHKLDIKEKLKIGTLMPVRRKIGRGMYKPKAKEFLDIEDIKGTVKDTSGNVAGLLRDQYDNVFRTGKVE